MKNHKDKFLWDYVRKFNDTFENKWGVDEYSSFLSDFFNATHMNIRLRSIRGTGLSIMESS